MEFILEEHPDPHDIDILESHISREACVAIGLGPEEELAIFVREAGTLMAGISGWTWGDCCELQNLWVDPSLRGNGLATRLLAAAEAEAEARGCTQTVHLTYDFQAQALYERNGYELVGRVESFHQERMFSGTASAFNRIGFFLQWLATPRSSSGQLSAGSAQTLA